MEGSEVIARQAKQIMELQDRISWFKNSEKEVYGIIYGIGGPLNDNKLGFNKEQMAVFLQIADIMGIR